MSVYKHKQGNYVSYRVARSVDGKLKQAYFPRTRKGLIEAKKHDEELAKDQERAQQFFTGPALRWQKKPKQVEKNSVTSRKRAKVAGRTTSQASRKSSGKASTRQVSANAMPKRAARAKASAAKTATKSRTRKTKA